MRTSGRTINGPEAHQEDRPALTRDRLRWFLTGGLSLRLTGWQRWTYAASSLYIGVFIIAAIVGVIPSAAVTVAAIALLAIAIAAQALLTFGPARVAAPARRSRSVR
jgi:VIT1/CCC1 family predicted Fe2+/Mn2+ transporter